MLSMYLLSWKLAFVKLNTKHNGEYIQHTANPAKFYVTDGQSKLAITWRNSADNLIRSDLKLRSFGDKYSITKYQPCLKIGLHWLLKIKSAIFEMTLDSDFLKTKLGHHLQLIKAHSVWE